jgi:ABC-type nitrate/sulfonate/bicarbonate transport system permease component
MCRRLHLPAVGSEIPSSLAVAVSAAPSLAITVILALSTSLASAARLATQLLRALNSSAPHIAILPLSGVWSPPNARDCKIYIKLLYLHTIIIINKFLKIYYKLK